MNADAVFRERIRAHEDAIRERDAMLSYYKQEGRAEGRAEGIAEGEVKGRAEGIAEALVSSIYNVMSSVGVGIDQAMKILSIPENDYAKYAALVKEKYHI